MAHFIGYLQGNRGQASRLGTKASGIYSKVSGWNIGAEIVIDYDENTKKDIVKIYKTGGSNGSIAGELLTTFTE